ncbi:MAG: nucleoside 2-deoxyribosyltransferase domain-containing protein [Paludibacter sp.]|nr:nucleoside 2-deoxyribosyltransferase domain-containing protein [Paludibacter sp.]
MKSSFNIYLSGGMKNLTMQQQAGYRNFLSKKFTEFDSEIYNKVVVFNPVMYFNYEAQLHKTEKQIFNFELNAVRRCDLLVVNFNDKRSIGTTVEMAVAYENKIPVVGLLEHDTNDFHEWHREMCDVIFEDINELIDYVQDYYLS